MISKRGRPGLRHILYLAALVAVAKNREFRELYAALTMRPCNPLKGKQALAAVAIKILRVACPGPRATLGGRTRGAAAGKGVQGGRTPEPANV